LGLLIYVQINVPNSVQDSCLPGKVSPATDRTGKPRIPGALRRKEGLTDEEVFRAAREKAISEPRERR